jgi:RND family efflux transporter MFP subunit
VNDPAESGWARSPAVRMAIAAVLGSAALGLGCRTGAEAEDESEPLVRVRVAEAEAQDLELSLEAPAVVFPREQANVTSTLTAPIRELRVRKGDSVAADQLLVVLEDRDLRAQERELQASVHRAEAILEKRRLLYGEGAIPQRELLLSETDLAESRARLDRVRAQLRFTELHSPFEGVVTEQFLFKGDMVKPDLPVLTVVDLRTAVVRAQVPESAVGDVRVGQPGAFTSADGTVEPARGRVTMVNAAVDPARRTVEIWCEIPNGGRRLRAGAFGTLSITTGTSTRSILVPRDAVEVSSEGQATVMVVDQNDVAHRRAVERGRVLASGVQILSGLEAGERIVTEAGYGLPDGTAVLVEEDDGP